MTYELGIDLGTTWTAAAVFRGERAVIVNLGTRQAAVPSVVYVGADGSVLVGEAAERRVLSEPERVARQFKRRIGDPAPILLGGSPHSAELLTSKLLRWVVDAVASREGEMPTTITITHPANWGAYKKGLLEQDVHLAGLSGPGNPTIRLLSEPEAAAIHYASTERVEPGQAVAVYDLGGGTFDVARPVTASRSSARPRASNGSVASTSTPLCSVMSRARSEASTSSTPTIPRWPRQSHTSEISAPRRRRRSPPTRRPSCP